MCIRMNRRLRVDAENRAYSKEFFGVHNFKS